MPYLYTCGAKAAFISPTRCSYPQACWSYVGAKDAQGLAQGGPKIIEKIQVCPGQHTESKVWIPNTPLGTAYLQGTHASPTKPKV